MDGIIGIEVYDAMIVDVDRWNPISRCGEKECFIKAKVARSGTDISVPVDRSITEANVLFPYEPGGIAC